MSVQPIVGFDPKSIDDVRDEHVGDHPRPSSHRVFLVKLSMAPILVYLQKREVGILIPYSISCARVLSIASSSTLTEILNHLRSCLNICEDTFLSCV